MSVYYLRVAKLTFHKFAGIFFTDGYFWHVQRRFSLRYMRDFGFGRREEGLEEVMANETKEMIDMVINGPKNDTEKVNTFIFPVETYYILLTQFNLRGLYDPSTSIYHL